MKVGKIRIMMKIYTVEIKEKLNDENKKEENKEKIYY